MSHDLQVLRSLTSCGLQVRSHCILILSTNLLMILEGTSMVPQAAADGGGCELEESVIEKQWKTDLMTFRFIIDGIITLPIALYGFLVFPDLPRTTKSFYLSEEVGTFTEQTIYFILAYFVMFPGTCLSIRASRRCFCLGTGQVSTTIVESPPKGIGPVEMVCMQSIGKLDPILYFTTPPIHHF
jgi:hypothetical protein